MIAWADVAVKFIGSMSKSSHFPRGYLPVQLFQSASHHIPSKAPPPEAGNQLLAACLAFQPGQGAGYFLGGPPGCRLLVPAFHSSGGYLSLHALLPYLRCHQAAAAGPEGLPALPPEAGKGIVVQEFLVLETLDDLFYDLGGKAMMGKPFLHLCLAAGPIDQEAAGSVVTSLEGICPGKLFNLSGR